MVFSSTIFIFIFMPVVYGLIFIIPSIKIQNYILLISSLIFYAWGEPVYIFLMIETVLINYILALYFDTKDLKIKKQYLILSVIINLGILAVFKYAGFILENINGLLNINIPIPHIAFPIGISFFTFQAMSYVIDVYRGQAPIQRNFFKLLLYISFFPQLIAGPIVKYIDINEQIDNRTISLQKASSGINRFIIGLSKKVLIANTTGKIVDIIFNLKNVEITTPLAWIGAIAYLLQLYFDFSGYSDMAIGLALMAGFDLKENFNYPYISKSIKEFWRRWHISLSTWFKEYVYIPLGGNRKGRHRTNLNLLIVFALTGIWHGASWKFIAWGLFHGLFIMLENYKIIDTEKIKSSFLKHTYVILVVVVGLVLFRAKNFDQTLVFLSKMFINFNFNFSSSLELLDNKTIIAILAGIICSTPILSKIKHVNVLNKIKTETGFACSLLLFIICIFFLSTSTYNPFIYFRF